MSQDVVMTVFQSAFTLVLKLAGPLLLVSLVVGLIISVLQAATQVHEQTLTFVPKLLIVALVLLLLGEYMMTSMTDFTTELMESILQLM